MLFKKRKLTSPLFRFFLNSSSLVYQFKLIKSICIDFLLKYNLGLFLLHFDNFLEEWEKRSFYNFKWKYYIHYIQQSRFIQIEFLLKLWKSDYLDLVVVTIYKIRGEDNTHKFRSSATNVDPFLLSSNFYLKQTGLQSFNLYRR